MDPGIRHQDIRHNGITKLGPGAIAPGKCLVMYTKIGRVHSILVPLSAAKKTFPGLVYLTSYAVESLDTKA